ncbi:energy transducer TonB [Flexithrix dorotheae]|uniref:energy transducer TonB n=1 Tax=Flexithrix dorotheae TaxID=70993 RepID=UPI000694DD0D|nr:energy transducer TonB [Flexithrix dorotheae]
MINMLSNLGILGVLAVFVVLILGTILIFKSILKKNSEKALTASYEIPELSKKSSLVDINKFSGLLGNIGLMLSLLIVLSAFEFPDFEERVLIPIGELMADPEKNIEIPITEMPPPPPPKKIPIPIVTEAKEDELEDEIEFEAEPVEETIIEEINLPKEPEPEEVVNDFVVIAEVNAEPANGWSKFYKYIKKTIKYPNQARKIGVEGKVYVQFIVNTDGTLSDIHILRGIGAGCDEEAIRILENSPKWNPGKQRGRPVRQRMVFPLHFKLGR